MRQGSNQTNKQKQYKNADEMTGMPWGWCFQLCWLQVIVITVFSDGHLQKALSPSLLDCLIDEVYLILQNITE